jgi:hypothetical protein
LHAKLARNEKRIANHLAQPIQGVAHGRGSYRKCLARLPHTAMQHQSVKDPEQIEIDDTNARRRRLLPRIFLVICHVYFYGRQLCDVSKQLT